MKKSDNIKKLIPKLNYKPSNQMQDRILGDILEIQKQKQLNNRKNIMKSRITKLAATAAIMAIAFIIGINSLNGTPAWAKVIQAFDQVENLHMIQKVPMPDGTFISADLWIRIPDCIREDNSERLMIDNGRQRLSINKSKKEAQFSESLIQYRSPAEHDMFNALGMFRKNGEKGPFEMEFLPDESNSEMLVYSLKPKGNNVTPAKGKAWVYASTMLPKRIVMGVAAVSNSNQIADIRSGKVEPEYINHEIIFDYDTIADDIFAQEVPQGYKELPRKQCGVMSGRVLDENEQPVANAIVYVTDRAGQFSKQTTTDSSGQFTFKLPPEGVGKTVQLPVLLRAFAEDIPDKIAWSIIKNPAYRRGDGGVAELGGQIPYDVTNLNNNGGRLKIATGITLKMESSGTIAGRITDTDGNPIADAKVKLLKCHLADKNGNAGLLISDVLKWSGHDGFGVVRTDKNGWYKLTNLPKLWKKTEFVIHAGAEGFAGDTAKFYAKGPIEHEEVDVMLYCAKLTVKGTLIDNYGKPIEAAYINAIVNGKTFRPFSAKTDKKGVFVLKGCPDTSKLQIKAILSHGFSKRGVQMREYFPDVLATIDYHEDKTIYEVEMIAERPELILNMEVKNTFGEIVKYFPVEIRGDAGTISSQWRVDKKFTRRTDENGKCRFTDVPNVRGLKLVLWGDNSLWNEKLSENEKIIVEENSKKYFWAEVPVEIKAGQKEYNITAVALTHQEWENRKK